MVNYLVTTGPGASLQSVEAKLTGVPGVEKAVFSRSLGGFIVKAPEGKADELEQVPGVSRAEVEKKVGLF
nr:hypothetical protein [uncultured bacterium]